MLTCLTDSPQRWQSRFGRVWNALVHQGTPLADFHSIRWIQVTLMFTPTYLAKLSNPFQLWLTFVVQGIKTTNQGDGSGWYIQFTWSSKVKNSPCHHSNFDIKNRCLSLRHQEKMSLGAPFGDRHSARTWRGQAFGSWSNITLRKSSVYAVFSK